MKFKAYTGITWSHLELSAVLEDEDSQVCFEKVKKHLGLHPFHLTNINAALNEILSSNLNSYDTELKGFLIAYKSPKLLTSLGEIVYDTCFVHIDIEADFYIFRPKIGCSLKGIVNKKGLSHIGVLVHKAFNVSIPKPDGEADWPGDKVKMGQEIRFHITNLDYTSRLPFIRGVLNKDDYLQGCRLPEPSERKTSICDYDEDNESEKDESNDAPINKTNNTQAFFSSNSECSSDEEIKAKVQQKKAKRIEKLKTQEPLEEAVGEEKQKKKLKKSKNDVKENLNLQEETHSVGSAILNNTSEHTDSEDEDEKSKAKMSIAKQDLKKPKTKSSKKGTEAEMHKTNSKVKKERVRSSSESIMGEDMYLKKEKTYNKKVKTSGSQKLLDISDTVIQESDIKTMEKSPSKKATKKSRITGNNTDMEQKMSTSVSSDANVTEHTEQQRKKKSKKHKHEEQFEISVEESDMDISQKHSVKTEFPKSTVFDSDSEIPPMKLNNRDITDINSSKKTKSSSHKSELLNTSPKIKVEKEKKGTCSGSENAVKNEATPQKIKSEKRLKNEKHQRDVNSDTYVEISFLSPNKIPIKKNRTSESDCDDASVIIKQERIEVNHVNSDSSDTNQNSSPSPMKKKSKKHRHTKELDNSNIEWIKPIANVTVYDEDSEIPIVKIKQEKEVSGYETYENETERQSIKSGQLPSLNTNSLEEDSTKKKKKKKKHDKYTSETSEFETPFEVTIKTERPHDYSPAKLNTQKLERTIKTEDVSECESNSGGSKKRSKKIKAIPFTEEIVRVKAEKWEKESVTTEEVPNAETLN